MNKTSDSSEILRLRKELVHARTQIADLQEELEEKSNLYVKAISDRDQYREKLQNAKQSINNVENIVQSKVNLAMDQERKELAKLREENELLRKRIEIFDQERLNLESRERQQQELIKGLNDDLAFYSKNADMRSCMNRIEVMRAEKDAKDAKIAEHLAIINEQSKQLEKLMAENRQLRTMANVPENFGVDLEQIKLLNIEKIDDYKKLIRVLQEDNYKLEEERARLKHMLKQQSMLYKTSDPVNRYKDLTSEQLFLVDQFVLKLKAGQTEEPADFYKLKKENQNLKAQLEALNTKGFDFAKAQIEAFLKELGLGDSGKLFEKLMSGNEELKKMIRELLTKGFIGGGTTDSKGANSFEDYGRFRPPVPHVGVDGQITSGFSYKFQTHLDVVDRDGRHGLTDQTKYDVAFLQLIVMEFIELVKRKDDELNNKNNEIESLYKRVRDYLLTQDQLYKDYIQMEKTYNKKREEVEVQLREARDQVHEQQIKLKKNEDLIKTWQTGDKNSIGMRLIELTKQNSLLDVNLLRLTRKYQTLAEQEQILRREYHNKEADMAEKDRFVQHRINLLKEWKARAIQQLKFLFAKLRLAVPRTEFQAVSRENETLKHKNADFIERNSKLAERVSKLQTQIRQNMEFEDKLKIQKEMYDDLESEFEVLKLRLESVDQNFKWENAVFNKVVAQLKRFKVSPDTAFKEFDVNNDGKISRAEFVKALDMLRIQDLSNNEIDALMRSMDYDNSGHIQYKEFTRKLQRHGIRSRTKEENIIYLIIESLNRAGIKSLNEKFEFFDKERKGHLSREDFKDAFKYFKVRISDEDLEKFIDHFWKDQKAGIDYMAFMRIFNSYQSKMDDDDRQNRKGYVKIPDEVIRHKKRIYDIIDKKLKDNGKTIKQMFDLVDIDQSNKIEFDEFKAMFDKMKVVASMEQIQMIFDSVDFDYNKTLEFPEFIHDFENTVNHTTEQLLQQERERGEQYARENSYSQKTMNEQQQYQRNATIAGGPGYSSNLTNDLKTKVAILEAREQQMQRRLQTSMSILNHAQQSQIEVQNSYNQLEVRWNELTKQYHLDQQRILELEETIRQCIKKDDAVRLQEINEKLRTDLTETRAAMNTYKNMTEVISDQVKGLKIVLERKKDENENLVNAVRELSSHSDDQQRLGKLYYLVMLSRWQEAAVNKKYDMILTENKDLRKELMNTEQMRVDVEKTNHHVENLLQDSYLEIEKQKKNLSDIKNFFLPLSKAEDLNRIITEISDEKTELEEQYFTMSTKYKSNQLMMDEALSKAEHFRNLLEILQKDKQSELSNRLIELSEKLQGLKLNDMRSQRELMETREKMNYLNRLQRQMNDKMRKYEEEVSELDSQLHKQKEEFRKADNDRMRKFFMAKFDDIPGSLQSNIDHQDSYPFKKRGAEGFRESQEMSYRSKSGARPDDNVYSPHKDRLLSQGSGNYDRQGSSLNQGNNNDVRMWEVKYKKLQEELAKAVEEIRGQTVIINKFKDWQLADKYLAEDEVLRNAMENQRTKVNQVHEQEAKEMAEAASQMVKTLQEMLNQKNEQLKSREEMINKIREQMMQQREQDGLEIARLQQELSLTAGTTLSKLNEIVTKNQHGQVIMGGVGFSKYEKLTREELSKNLEEKDNVIQRVSAEIKGLIEQVKYLKDKNMTLNDQINELSHELHKERQQEQLKVKSKELDDLKRLLAKKDTKMKDLNNTIADLNRKIMDLGIATSNNKEDEKMLKIREDMNGKKYEADIKDLKYKLNLITGSRDQKQKELNESKVKIQELNEQIGKLIKDKSDMESQYQLNKQRLDQEMRQREKIQIELNNVKGQIQVGKGLGSSTGPSYEQLLVKNKELQNDNIILQCQQKTVVTYNKESGTFEYIGEPIPLNLDREITDIEEFLASMKQWLTRNERLTVKSIFESIDKENYGELSEMKFDQAMKKLGINLRNGEKRLLKDLLDPKNIGFIKYRPLVKELSGIPQQEFQIREIQKLARLCESRDLDLHQFKQLIDPDRLESMNLTQLQENFRKAFNEQFQMSNDEVEYLFKSVTKSVRTIGVNISINRLTDKVFYALDALLIDMMKENIARSTRPMIELFSRFDSNKDNFLEYAELENLLLDCSVAFKPNMLKKIYELLDPGRRASKISINSFKHYLSDASVVGGVSSSVHMASRSYDFEPSQERASLSLEATHEESNICRSGARKILQHFQASLLEQLSNRDKHNEGIIPREDVYKLIEDAKVPELTIAELNILMKFADRGNKGFICVEKFVEKLQELATETKQDANLRGFAVNCKRQGINLKQELFKYDTTRTAKIDKKTFFKAMNQLPVSLSDEQMEMLYQSGELPNQRGTLDIKHFLDKISECQKYKPLQQNFQMGGQQQKSLKPGGKTLAGEKSATFENWEAEKKYKTKLVALQQQIEESKKETQAVEKQAKHWQEMANKLEKEKNSLQARLVDFNAKPPKAATLESLNNASIEQTQQLKDQVFYLQQENTKLERVIQVELKSEISKQQKENDKLVDKNRSLTDEIKRLEYQVNRLIGKPMDEIERREEGELTREKKIIELEKEIQAREDREHQLQEQLYKNEEKLLDLKFQKETFDLQFSRLQKRNTDLEQYKLASSQLSAVLKKQDERELDRIDEVSNTIGGLHSQNQTKKNQDTVKLKSKSSKSIAELEMLIESLKRVIEKQKSENDSLKKQVDAYEQQKNKLKSEKQLRQKIESLEQEVHSYEMKDVNLSEKDKTIKKLIEANRDLREDLHRETDRYTLLENKYKDILVKYNVLAKENSKNAELLFSMNTGANINNYQNYLYNDQSKKQDDSYVKGTALGKRKTGDADRSLDRNFEDIF